MKKKFFIKICAVLLCLALMLPLCSCSASTSSQKQLFAMDTVMTLTAYGSSAQSGLDAAASVIGAMDAMLDPDLADSYTYLLNNANGEDVIVSPQVYEMLSTALSVSSRSGGALNLALYPVYLAWGQFKQESGRVPGSDELKELLNNTDFDKVAITEFPGEANCSVRMPAGMQISFAAVAKGFAAEYAIDAMRNAGVESGIVSLGGNVQTLGLKPDGSNWTIAVEDPADTGSYVGTLSVGETAVVTSGSYQRYFTADDGTKYHHLLDPETGKPVDNDLVSVTVICSDGTLADCLSTAMFVLGESKALQYWRDHGGFDMIMINEDNEVICTGGLIEVFKLTNTDDYTVRMVE